MIPLLTLAAWLALQHGDSAPPVSVGPAALTLPEIARALTVDGRSVTCAAGLRNRAAVICLRKRSWSDARGVLSTGLGVRIRPHPDLPDAWLMEADPGEEVCEKQMRGALAGLLKEALEKEIAPLRSTFNQQVHVLAERQMRMQLELSRLEKTDPEHNQPRTERLADEVESGTTAGDPFQQVAARLAAATPVSHCENAIRGPQAFRPADIHRLVNVPALCRLMLAGMEQDLANNPPDHSADSENTATADNPFMSIPAMRSLLERVAAGQIALEQRIYFDPATFRVTAQQLYSIGGPIVFRHGITAQMMDESGAAGLLKRMGGLAASRLEANRQETGRAFASTTAKQPFPVPRTEVASSLSRLVERWAEQTSGEVVMELAPMREGVDTTRYGADGGSERSRPSTVYVSLAQAMGSGSAFPWSVMDRGGVLVVQNPLAFMDRGAPIPLAALLRLERKVNQQAGRSPSLAELTELHASSAPVESAAIRYCGVSYRGLDAALLASSRFAMALRRLSNRERGALLAQLARAGTVDVPLASLSPREVREIVVSLRARSLCEESADDACWLPEAERIIAAGILRLDHEEAAIHVRLLVQLPIPNFDDVHELASTTLWWK